MVKTNKIVKGCLVFGPQGFPPARVLAVDEKMNCAVISIEINEKPQFPTTLLFLTSLADWGMSICDGTFRVAN